LLLDEPRKYNLPEAPSLPQDRTLPGVLAMAATAVVFTLTTALSLKRG